MRVYIDGENVRHTLARILCAEGSIGSRHDMTAFPLRRLIEALVEEEAQITYYASRIKLPVGYEPSVEILDRANQIKEFARKWVPHLALQDIEYVKAGYLKVKSGQTCPKCWHTHDLLQEKGVDVRIAVDVLDHAHQNPKQTIAIFSSDTDLIPALDRVKKNGTRVVYIAHSEAINRAIDATAHETITFTARKVTQLYKEHRG
ncbi:MAG TPA: NYN domain-containing protein [Candidatus Polarisedimenticolaceae bacterium]|nr:NYN domain-containing protein [Candidatus Polarisedimenticolaceae bacterium]